MNIWFTLSLLLTVVLAFASAETFYVTPSLLTSQCPESGMPCFTLSQYARKSKDYFATNNTFVILPGNHTLDTEFSVQNMSFLTVTAWSETLSNAQNDFNATVISCTNSAHFTVKDIVTFVMKGLILQGCVNNSITTTNKFTLQDVILQGLGQLGTGFQLNLIIKANIIHSVFSMSSTTSGLKVASETKSVLHRAISVSNCDNVTISNCLFANNSVMGTDTVAEMGAAISAEYNNAIMITNTTFYNNTIEGNLKSRGGAISAIRSNLTIVGSEFMRNDVVVTDNIYSLGGALFAFGSDSIVIHDSSFITNSAVQNGNHYTSGFNAALEMYSSHCGGALSVHLSNLHIDRCEFINNNVIGGEFGEGGALCSFESNTTVSASNFVSNFVQNSTVGLGGAVYSFSLQQVFSAADLSSKLGFQFTSSIAVNKCSFTENFVTGISGGDFFSNVSSAFSFFGSTKNNFAPGLEFNASNSVLGGAVCIFLNPVTISNSIFIDNYLNADNSVGGAVSVLAFSRHLSTIINGNIFIGNKLWANVGYGGAVSVLGITILLNPILISNCTFMNNSVIGTNGSIISYNNISEMKDVRNTPRTGAKINLSNLVFSGAIHTEFVAATVSNNSFMDNSASGKNGVAMGGAMCSSLSIITLNRNKFISNFVDNDIGGGGAVCAKNITLYMDQNDFLNNFVTSHGIGLGGAIITIGTHPISYTVNSISINTAVNVYRCTFINNTVIGVAKSDNGEMDSEYPDVFLEIMDSISLDSLTNVSTVVAGGAIISHVSDLIILYSTFGFNTVNGDSAGTLAMAAAVLTSESNARVFSNYFTSNSVNITLNSTGLGGAVAVMGKQSIYSMYNCIFTDNSIMIQQDSNSDYGSGVSGTIAESYTTGSADNYSYYDPQTILSLAGGGAVYTSWSKNHFNNVTFVNNAVNLNKNFSHIEAVGGAMVSYLSDTTLISCKFINNRVFGFEGGALYVINGTITVTSGVFVDNIVMTQHGREYQPSKFLAVSYYRNPYRTLGGASGGAMCTIESKIFINDSTFRNNEIILIVDANSLGVGAFGSGVAAWDNHVLSIHNSKFVGNRCSVGLGGTAFGGALYAVNGTVALHSTIFRKNVLYINSSGNNRTIQKGSGAAVSFFFTIASLSSCLFASNALTLDGKSAEGGGGALVIFLGIIFINDSTFLNNSVTGDSFANGGAIFSYRTVTVLTYSVFTKNTAIVHLGDAGGGAISFNVGIFNMSQCSFTSNKANGRGGAIFLSGAAEFNSEGFLHIENNIGNVGAFYAVASQLNFWGSTFFSKNNGSFYVTSCAVSFMEHTSINNSNVNEGGAITSFRSSIKFKGLTKIVSNTAQKGGGIFISESEIVVHTGGSFDIMSNAATSFGGGIYAYRSDLENLNGTLNVKYNRAISGGGGIYSISTTTKVRDGSKIIIVGNHAQKGGGVYLAADSKIYINKYGRECTYVDPLAISLCGNRCNNSLCNTDPERWIKLDFTRNSADYGGAIYVDDNTYSDVCYAVPFSDKFTTSSECFIQALGNSVQSSSLSYFYQAVENIPFDVAVKIIGSINLININFTNNFAKLAGKTIFGGLLDRCTVSPLAEIFTKYVHLNTRLLGVPHYIGNISNLIFQHINSTDIISSYPVRVCFCRKNFPDCSHQIGPKYIRKGEKFTLSLVAVDQVNNSIANSSIHGFVSLQANLGEGQAIQLTNLDGSCTELTYSVFSLKDAEQLFLYADGPCADIGISKTSVAVNIAPCPIGFYEVNRTCECDPELHPVYISSCDIDTESVQRRGNVWFAFINSTDFQGYVLHKHCPFDYCQPSDENISVNLNLPNGADVICAFNRSGKLCGSCKDELSLTFGSSQCLPCNNNSIAIISLFAAMGIALITFVLVCNLTVAVGTINNLIFYANVFAANRAVFFPFQEPSILTIFIAWLNLDFGFETCFYDGMDAYVKTWLQLAFPLYIITLVALVIVVSDRSPKFAALFGRFGKNAVATLATLILISYTKLIRIIINSLSLTTLEYSDGSHELVWLADGNVPYLKGKHIPLFIVALIIIAVGTIYTILFLFQQWLNFLISYQPFKWIATNPRVFHFIDAYHNPFNKQHRYWIGLLLLVRVVLYVVLAVNVLGDPRINLLTINSTIIALLFFRHAAEYKYKIHKSLLTSTLESISLLNLVSLTSITFYITEESTNQAAVANTSMTIEFVIFLTILVRHFYNFVLPEKRKEQIRSCWPLCKKWLPHRSKTWYTSLRNDTSSLQPGTPDVEDNIVTETVIDINQLEPKDTDEDDSQNISTNKDQSNDCSSPESEHTVDSRDTSSQCFPPFTSPVSASHHGLSVNVEIELHNLASKCTEAGHTPD